MNVPPESSASAARFMLPDTESAMIPTEISTHITPNIFDRLLLGILSSMPSIRAATSITASSDESTVNGLDRLFLNSSQT